MSGGRAVGSIVLVGALAVGTLLAGCTSYYKVSDPSSGRSYYTSKIKSRKGGAVQFTDLQTGADITMQNSVVLKVDEAEAMNPPSNDPAPAANDGDGDGDGE